MSQYIRKTEDEFEIQQHYPQYGWELATTETNRKDARVNLRCYRENDPSGVYRIVKKRVRLDAAA